jgi:hypothetical protein
VYRGVSGLSRILLAPSCHSSRHALRSRLRSVITVGVNRSHSGRPGDSRRVVGHRGGKSSCLARGDRRGLRADRYAYGQ